MIDYGPRKNHPVSHMARGNPSTPYRNLMPKLSRRYLAGHAYDETVRPGMSQSYYVDDLRSLITLRVANDVLISLRK